MVFQTSQEKAGVGGRVEKINAMTVDVEDYFQVSAFEGHIGRDHWDDLPHRIEFTMDRILELFSAREIKATFFTLGWIAERYPGIIQRLVAEGHELASHGWSHVRVTDQDEATFREDVRKTKIFLEDLSGSKVNGYRAASYSIGKDNLWALRVLGEVGYEYSSSIYPIRHDHYGMPDAPRFAFRPHPDSQFLEVPVTTMEVVGNKLPCGGGGYFRLFPYFYSKWAMDRVNMHDDQSCVFYFHPWEIDSDQPRQRGLGLKTKTRHYLNLGKMERRIGRLLSDFSWGRMDDVFLRSKSESTRV